VETNHDLTRGAKFLVEHGHDIDFGPGEHGIGEQHYLYFRDPVGLRYELNSGGYRNYVPDWEPAIWRFEDGPNNSYRTEIGMPAVHMVEIPPGIVGRNEEMIQGIVAKG
jgi:catechol 2,3-dioxygenase